MQKSWLVAAVITVALVAAVAVVYLALLATLITSVVHYALIPTSAVMCFFKLASLH
jgi:hypothetical protein